MYPNAFSLEHAKESRVSLAVVIFTTHMFIVEITTNKQWLGKQTTTQKHKGIINKTVPHLHSTPQSQPGFHVSKGEWPPTPEKEKNTGLTNQALVTPCMDGTDTKIVTFLILCLCISSHPYRVSLTH